MENEMTASEAAFSAFVDALRNVIAAYMAEGLTYAEASDAAMAGAGDYAADEALLMR